MVEPEDKAARRAAALRANLRKRKDQARATAPQPAESEKREGE
jgi:hypothetical protein